MSRREITLDEQLEILHRLDEGYSYGEIQERFNISRTVVNHLVSARNAGAPVGTKYTHLAAQRNGYKNHSQYRSALTISQSQNHPGTTTRLAYQAQRKFEEQIVSLETSEFEDIPDRRPLLTHERALQREAVNAMISYLSQTNTRWHKVIVNRFFTGKTRAEIGAEMGGISHQCVSQFEERALRLMREYCIREKLFE